MTRSGEGRVEEEGDAGVSVDDERRACKKLCTHPHPRT